MKDKLAKIITFVFDPTVIVPLFFAILISETDLSPSQMKIIMPFLFLIDLVLPASIFLLFLREGWVSDWEISNRKERFKLYAFISLFWFIGSGVVYFWGTKLLFQFHLIFTLSFFIATIITFFWKISMHVLVYTTVVILLSLLIPRFCWLYFFLPIIAWSRFIRHKHTPGQLLGGFLLAATFIFLSFRLFGYL